MNCECSIPNPYSIRTHGLVRQNATFLKFRGKNPKLANFIGNKMPESGKENPLHCLLNLPQIFVETRVLFFQKLNNTEKIFPPNTICFYFTLEKKKKKKQGGHCTLTREGGGMDKAFNFI